MNKKTGNSMVRKEQNKIFHIIGFCLIAYFMFATEAIAHEPDKEDYVRGDFIWSIPTRKISSENTKDPDSNAAGSVGIGHCFSEHFRGDITATLRRYKYKSAQQSQHLRTTSVMASGYFNIGSYEKVKIYVMAGAGAAFNKSGDFHYIEDGFGTPSVVFGDTTTSFAWQAGLGGLLEMAENLYADFMYKYVTLGDTYTKNVSCGHGGVNVCAGVGEQRGSVKNHEFSIGVIFKF